MSSAEDSSSTYLKKFIDNNKTANYSNNNELSINLNKFKALPPISKIPGLNPDSDVIALAQQKTFRTFKVRETDSSYVKLAKQGGRKDLLQYEEFKNIEAATLSVDNNNKCASKMNWRPNLLDYEEHRANVFEKLNEKTIILDSNNNNSSIINNNNNNNNNNDNVKTLNAPGKRIMEIKKQSRTLKSKKHPTTDQNMLNMKERPDILPVDNFEILRHLSVPKKELPKLKNPSKVVSRSDEGR